MPSFLELSPSRSVSQWDKGKVSVLPFDVHSNFYGDTAWKKVAALKTEFLFLLS